MNTVVCDPQRPASPTDSLTRTPVRLTCISGGAAERDAPAQGSSKLGDAFASRSKPNLRLGRQPGMAFEPPISDAMAPLRDTAASLFRARTGRFPSGGERQRLFRRARRAGLSVLPSLLRALGSDSDTEAAWAHCLLRAVADNDDKEADAAAVRERILERLNQILASPRPADAVKARVLSLLSDLGAPLGEKVVLHDPDALLAGSVRELLSSLDSPQELRQALELIFTQVPASELPVFLQEVAHHGGAQARPLMAALVADPRLAPELAQSLMAQYRPTRLVPAAAQVTRRRPRSARERMGARLGRALALLNEGKLPQARVRLTRLLPEFAEQPAVHSALGLCLLRLGEPQSAIAPLQCALELEPAVAAHAWNLASAAHAAKQLGVCHRSLRRYLEQSDDSEGAASRRRTAESFCRSYEQSLPGSLTDPALALAGAGEE